VPSLFEADRGPTRLVSDFDEVRRGLDHEILAAYDDIRRQMQSP